MRRLLLILLALCGIASAQTTIGNNNNQAAEPTANWAQPHWHRAEPDDCTGPCSPTSAQLGYSFTFTASENHTAAKVYNSAGTQVRLLWSNESFPAGTYYKLWDGLDDFGNAVTTGGPFNVKVEADNVTYAWALVGNTESDWLSPTSISSFWGDSPLGIAWIGSKGYVASGYEENTVSSSYINQSNPNGGVHGFIDPRLVNRSFYFVATDGNLLYYAQQLITTNTVDNYVMAVNPGGQPYSFQQGTTLSDSTMETETLVPSYFPALTVLDGQAYSSTTAGTGITGLAVQKSGNIFAVAHGEMWDSASADVIHLFNKTTGASLGSVSITDPHLMAFDLNGNLWVVSGEAGNGAGNKLYEITGVGSTNAVTTPIAGLLDPVGVSVSPTTGDLFVMDGSTHQQVYEYNTTTYALVSTLGQAGGYGAGSAMPTSIRTDTILRPSTGMNPSLKTRKVLVFIRRTRTSSRSTTRATCGCRIIGRTGCSITPSRTVHGPMSTA